MNKTTRYTPVILGLLFAAPHMAFAQATLIQTIDLKAWPGVPVTIVQPPPPQPAGGFSLTSIAFNPTNHTIYVADYTSTNIYAIDSATNSVTSAVYTNGLFASADIGATQNLPGTAPKVVLANPVTNRWIFLGQGGGAEFSGTTFVEGINARAFQSGGAWDPATDNVYGADGMEFFAVNNLKFLFGGYPCAGSSNSATFNPMTSRAYVSCGTGQSGGIAAFDGVQLSNASVKNPVAPLGSAILGTQPTGLAVNPNTNRLYVAGMTGPTSLDVLDASTYRLLVSIPGLPDQSTDFLIAGFNVLSLPRPVAVNTRTNTIFVLNSVSSTISVIDGNTNTLTGTIAIPTPAGAVVSQPVATGTLLSEIKPGNTIYDSSAHSEITLGGAISMTVNEASNLLYVASVNGTVGVFALNTPAAPPAFSINGVIRNAQGVPVPGITVNAAGPAGNATAVTDATGLFVLTGLQVGSVTLTPASPAFSFSPASQGVSVIDRNLGGLAFQANPPIVPVTYTLSPWTMIGAGVTTTATVTLNQPAPTGGALLALGSSNPKGAKVPANVTVPAGQSSVSFPVQGSGVSATTLVTLTAQYNGGTATRTLTVAPGDSLHITSATYSASHQLLQVNATGSNPAAIIEVQNANTNAILGVMTNVGGGNYSFQLNLAAGVPSSVSILSNLGGKTGQGVTVTP
jgi:hypothetical protein